MSFCSSGSKPADRNMATEGLATLDAYKQVAPEIFELESTWRPKYAELNADIISSVLPKYTEMYGDFISSAGSLVNSANSAQREGQLNDISSLGGDMVEAIKNIDPTQKALMDELNRQAMEELSSGGGLSARESYDASQAARQAGQARGTLMGNSTIFNELLNNEEARNAREDRARNFATNVSSLNANYYNAPALNALSENSPLSTGVSGNMLNMMSGGQTSSGMFNPYTSYASDLYNTNYNAAYSDYLNNQDNFAKGLGTILGIGGGVAGGIFGGPAGAAAGYSAGNSIGNGVGTMFR